MRTRRRGVLGAPLAIALVLAAGACTSSEMRARGSDRVLRLGLFPTLTHAPALVGIGSGIFEEDLAPTRVEPRYFNSGTEAGIAMLSGSIDASFMGPWPAASLFLQSGKVAVISGATVGGASFVVRRQAGIDGPWDLRGRKIAVPNIGNAQDIALRTWLRDQGLDATDEGGDVSITERNSPELLQLFRAGRLDGAWAPEPYPTYLISQGVADLLVDEASLWPPGQMLTTNLVVSTIYLEEHADVVERLVLGTVDAIRFTQAQPERAQQIALRELVGAGGPRLSPDVLQDAWSKLEFTWEPLPESMVRVTSDGLDLGILSGSAQAIAGIYRLDALQAVLDDEGLPPVEVP